MNHSENYWTLAIYGEVVKLQAYSQVELSVGVEDSIDVYAIESFRTNGNIVINRHGFIRLFKDQGSFSLQQAKNIPVILKNMSNDDLLLENGKKAEIVMSGDNINLSNFYINPDSTIDLQFTQIGNQGELNSFVFKKYQVNFYEGNGYVYLSDSRP